MFGAICDDVQAAVAGLWGRTEARTVQGRGAGGDGTVYIDAVAEDLAVRRLEAEAAAGRGFHLISEEIGERTFGEGGDVVVLDPIDGSHNAKMGIPFFSITLAAARDRTYGSVYEACVRNLATGDHYEASLGGGARGRGDTLRTDADADQINVLQLEATRLPRQVGDYVVAMTDAEKIRILGSAALNICLVATGAVSVTLAPTLRSVDAAAALLILSEAGGAACDYEGNDVAAVDMALDQRISVVAASNPGLMRRGLDALHQGMAERG